MGLKDRQEFARWTVETSQEEDPIVCKSWHERLVFLRSIKSLTVERAVQRVGGMGRGKRHRGSCMSCQGSWNLSCGAVGVLESLGRRLACSCLYFCKPLWQSSKAGVLKVWSLGKIQLTACFCLKHSIATAICLCIISGCFCAPMPVLSS